MTKINRTSPSRGDSSTVNSPLDFLHSLTPYVYGFVSVEVHLPCSFTFFKIPLPNAAQPKSLITTPVTQTSLRWHHPSPSSTPVLLWLPLLLVKCLSVSSSFLKQKTRFSWLSGDYLTPSSDCVRFKIKNTRTIFLFLSCPCDQSDNVVRPPITKIKDTFICVVLYSEIHVPTNNVVTEYSGVMSFVTYVWYSYPLTNLFMTM